MKKLFELRQSRRYGLLIFLLAGANVTCAYGDQTGYRNNGFNGGFNSGFGGGFDNSIQYFADAERAARSKDDSALYQYEQSMAGGLFAMYPAYWRLNNGLDWQNSATISQFARQYPNTAMAEKLAADFAESRAKQRDYASVRQVANLINNADRSEQCAIALGFNAGGDPMRAIVEKPNVWLTTKKQPELCEQLASEMNNHPMISQEDRLARLKRMLRVGNIAESVALASRLGVPLDYATLSSINANPSAFFMRFNSQGFSQTNQFLYLFALAKMARSSYYAAYNQLQADLALDNQRSQPLLREDTRRYAYRILGVQRMNHNTDDGFNIEALTWLRQSLGEPFNFEEAEDYAQAAIRFSQWQDVINAIANLDIATQQEPIWQYWLARSYEQVGDANQKTQARQIYQRLAQQNDYYGLLAKDKIGIRPTLNSLGNNQLPNISSQEQSRMLQNPHFARAFALRQNGAPASYANREWNWAVKQARDNRDTNMILAAARYAHDIGWLDRAIYAIDNSPITNLALSHPTPMQQSVLRHSRNVGIDPAWAYGIMRQESRFNTNARSGVGASGLMQIMPGTAKTIAKNLGESYNLNRINSGDTNVRYGTWYMNHIMGKVGQQPTLATAGYNAGYNKAQRWRPDQQALPADQYTESIPYPETRDYVKKVMTGATLYSARLGNPTPITQRMGIVYP